MKLFGMILVIIGLIIIGIFENSKYGMVTAFMLCLCNIWLFFGKDICG